MAAEKPLALQVAEFMREDAQQIDRESMYLYCVRFEIHQPELFRPETIPLLHQTLFLARSVQSTMYGLCSAHP